MMRAVLGLTLLLAGPALANDSEAELAIGGLVMRQNDEIEMRSEDLFISKDRVTVDYVFHNHSDQDLTLTVAFPLPSIGVTLDEPVATYPRDDMGPLVDFQIEADGQPVVPLLEQIAILDGQNVTRRLRDAGLPIDPLRFESSAAAMADPDLLIDGWAPRWQLQATYYWQQTFPAGRDLHVHHSYRPATGAGFYSPDELSTESDDPFWARYCLDPGIISGARRMLDRAGVPIGVRINLGYILTTGANWRGPIGRFHLTVEKPGPDSLVSFCATGVTKTSPTRFEVTYDDFIPERDLDVLWLTVSGGNQP